MIHLVKLNGKPLKISVAPLPIERKLGEDQSLWRQVSHEVGVNELHYFIATEKFIYLEEKASLHIAQLVVDAIKGDEGLLAVSGHVFDFAVAFDTSICLLSVRITDSEPIVEDAELLSSEDAVRQINDSTTAAFYFNGGALTQTLIDQNCIQADDLNLDFLAPNPLYQFKRAFDSSFLFTIGLISVMAIAILVIALKVANAFNTAEEVVEAPLKAPEITNDLRVVIRNIANTQHQYVPLLTYGLRALSSSTSNSGISVTAKGKFNRVLSQRQFSRITAIAKALGGNARVNGSGWLLDNLPSPLPEAPLLSIPLTGFSGELSALLSLQNPRVEFNLGSRLERRHGSGNYVEYLNHLTIETPTKSYLLGLADMIEKKGISAQYLAHEYRVDNARFEELEIELLVRGTSQ